MRRMCEAERPVIDADQQIVFTRTVPHVPPIYSAAAVAATHRRADPARIRPDQQHSAPIGAWCSRKACWAAGRWRSPPATRLADVPAAVEFLAAAVETIDAVLDLARRYAEAARAAGATTWPRSSTRARPSAADVPRGPAIVAADARGGVAGRALSRRPGPLRPVYVAVPGCRSPTRRLDEAGAEELLAEFFISLNRDSDLYPGVQQGDNGQSLMLGGVTRDGSCGVNPLTAMALRAARDVAMIDPKINLRISKDTDLDLLALAAELTAQGLGFPQYSNDDVVIPALVAHGYDLEDARDYTVAACWEFIIPGKGMEVVNIGAVSMPAAVDVADPRGLAAGERFEAILDRAEAEMGRQVESGRFSLPSPIAAAGAVLLGPDGRLPGIGPRSFAGPEVQQLRRPWGLLRPARPTPWPPSARWCFLRSSVSPAELIARPGCEFRRSRALCGQDSWRPRKSATTTMRPMICW